MAADIHSLVQRNVGLATSSTVLHRVLALTTNAESDLMVINDHEDLLVPFQTCN